ncbi:MAG TPA: NAD(P)-dependent oxidoreductase [Thermoanaerobaculia bacterium]|jgi:dTDP-4-dehydrorhamnose reductase
MRVAITGARGLVGSALARRYPDAVRLTHRDLDITDRDAVSRVVGGFDLVFNCAVIGVDDCEEDPALARAVNVDGPVNLAEAAKKIVHFSTNYVFGGDEKKFYSVDDDARPVNVYGATKLEGERAVLARSENALVIRTSWVYGPWKENFLSTVGSRLERGERVKAIGDVFASCTYVEDLVDTVAKLLEERGVRHVVNEGVLSYADFARELTGDPSLIEVVSERDAMRAPRPRHTPLHNSLTMRDWREALRGYRFSRHD